MSDALGAQLAAPLPLQGSAHLDRVTREVGVLATELRRLVDHARTHAPAALDTLRIDARRAALEATLRLDGAGAGWGSAATSTVDGERAGTWVDALEHSPGIGFDTPDLRDDAEVTRLTGLEHDGVRAGQDAADLAAAFAGGSADAAGLGGAIIALHARLTEGLVAPERVGLLRRGPRVVHDASVGRIIHFPTEPDHLGSAWEGLLRSLTAISSPQARAHAVVRSGLLQLELLRHHPFDAANGRLARAAARLMLQADGLIDDAAAPEAVLAEDPLGYLDGVAASLRRRDATSWVERWAEAVGESLVRALLVLRPLVTDEGPSSTADDALAGLDVDDAAGPDSGSGGITLAGLAQHLDVDIAHARDRASELIVAGVLRRLIGSGGLRLARR